MTQKERQEHIRDAEAGAKLGDYIADADRWQGDRTADRTSVALGSIAHSLAAIAGALDALAGDTGILWTGDSGAV